VLPILMNVKVDVCLELQQTYLCIEMLYQVAELLSKVCASIQRSLPLQPA